MSEVKEKLLAEIQTLPDHRVAEVLDYIHFLQYQERYLVSTSTSPVVDSSPLHQFIGGVEHGTLAQNIDNDVYAL